MPRKSKKAELLAELEGLQGELKVLEALKSKSEDDLALIEDTHENIRLVQKDIDELPKMGRPPKKEVPEKLTNKLTEEKLPKKETKEAKVITKYLPPKQHLKTDEWKQSVWATLERMHYDTMGEKKSNPISDQAFNPLEFKQVIRNATLVGFTHVIVHYHPDMEGFKKWYEEGIDPKSQPNKGKKADRFFPVYSIKFGA